MLQTGQKFALRALAPHRRSTADVAGIDLAFGGSFVAQRGNGPKKDLWILRGNPKPVKPLGRKGLFGQETSSLVRGSVGAVGY